MPEIPDGAAPPAGPGAPPAGAPSGFGPAQGWGPQAPAQHPAGGHPYGYGYGGAPVPPVSQKRGARTAIAVVVGLVVLAGIGGGVYALTQNGNGDSNDAAPAPSSAPSQPGPPSDGPEEPGGPGGESGAPEGQPSEDGFATDAASGISMPVPDGWTGESQAAGAGLTTDPYKCPGTSSQSCVRGGVFSAPAPVLEIKATKAEAAAKEDISVNAESSYGGATYGKITSHEELASEAVTVAGEKGYLVRWKVVTQKGDDGYVQSLAFPSPKTPGLIVMVRFGLDVSDKAPKVSVMDEITQGIKKAEGGGGSAPGEEV